MKDKLIGVVVTMTSSMIMFLLYNLVGSFETKAGSESKYSQLNYKIDIILCYMDKKHCLQENK